MPNSLLQAIKMDLESGYMAVKRKENWEAICSSVILKIIQSKSFFDDGFKYTSTYVNSKPKEVILQEIKEHVYKADNLLDMVTLAKNAASGIVYNILENETYMENQNSNDENLSQEGVTTSIVTILCNKIDKINANDNFKKYIKSQIIDGTISDDELRRYGIITEEEILKYHNHFENGNYVK